jgi:hypothetical protein
MGYGGCRKVEDAKSGSGSEGVFTRLASAYLLPREGGRHLLLSRMVAPRTLLASFCMSLESRNKVLYRSRWFTRQLMGT